MGRYYHWQIVETLSHGDFHPVVLIDSDEGCNCGEPILGIIISSVQTNPTPYYHIKVHDGYEQDPVTRLYRPCWAKCNLVRQLEPHRIRRAWGHMPESIRDHIQWVKGEMKVSHKLPVGTNSGWEYRQRKQLEDKVKELENEVFDLKQENRFLMWELSVRDGTDYEADNVKFHE